MRLPVFVVCAGLLAAGCDIQVGDKGITSVSITEGRASDEWVRSYPGQAGTTLEIVNVNGRIEATGSTGTQIEVHAERTIRRHGTEAAEAELKRVQMREDVSANRIRIEVQPPRSEAILDHSSVTVNYRISVPRGVAVAIKSENGRIRLANLEGPVTAATTNGGITGEALGGPAVLTTTNGDVRVDLASLSADTKLTTINGNVRVDVGPDVKATLDATCVNGNVNVADGLNLQATEQSQRRVAGTFNGGGPRIEASTVNGAVRIRPRDGRPD